MALASYRSLQKLELLSCERCWDTTGEDTFEKYQAIIDSSLDVPFITSSLLRIPPPPSNLTEIYYTQPPDTLVNGTELFLNWLASAKLPKLQVMTFRVWYIDDLAHLFPLLSAVGSTLKTLRIDSVDDYYMPGKRVRRFSMFDAGADGPPEPDILSFPWNTRLNLETLDFGCLMSEPDYFDWSYDILSRLAGPSLKVFSIRFYLSAISDLMDFDWTKLANFCFQNMPNLDRIDLHMKIPGHRLKLLESLVGSDHVLQVVAGLFIREGYHAHGAKAPTIKTSVILV